MELHEFVIHCKINDIYYISGMEVHGVPAVVVSGGRVVKDEEGLHLTQGSGQFVPTPPNAPYVYGRVALRDQVLSL